MNFDYNPIPSLAHSEPWDFKGQNSGRETFQRGRFGAAVSALRLFGAADSVLRLFGAETIQRRDDSVLADSTQAISATGRLGAGTFRHNFILLLQ